MLIHAAGESSPGDLPPSTYAVALSCRDEAELQALAVRLETAGLRHHLVRESDAPYNGQLMAIGLFPVKKSQARRCLSSLPKSK